MIKVRWEDLFFFPITLAAGTIIGGAVGTLSAMFLVWFFGGQLHQYFAVGAGIGFLLGLLFSISLMRSRMEEEGDVTIDVKFPLQLTLAISLTGAVCAVLDTWWNGPRMKGGIVPYMAYLALIGAVLGLAMGIFWILESRKLPLRDEQMLNHEDELMGIGRD